MTNRAKAPRVLLMLGLAGALVAATLAPVGASSHREAPLITEDPVADNTDLYAYVTEDAPDHLTVVMNVYPFREPAGGPNFDRFGDDVDYELKIDNDGDGVQDLDLGFRFNTNFKSEDTFLYNTGPITYNADTDSYDGLNVEQRYVVEASVDGRLRMLASDLLAAPARVGLRSTDTVQPYDELAAAAVHEVDLGEAGTMKVFAGSRDEVFPVDLGSIFDLGGLRPLNEAHLIPLPAEDGINTTLGFNVNSIIMQIPLDYIVEDDPVLGLVATTFRRQTRVTTRTGDISHRGAWIQVSRLGNPLVNEVVIPLGEKDRFNATRGPKADARFLEHVVDPELGRLIPVLYPGVVVPEAPRNDLVEIFLTGIAGVNQPEDVVPSEQLRINTDLPSGFPNGRLLTDDVVDIELQAVAGVFCEPAEGGGCSGVTLAGDSPFNVSPNNALTDGASGNDLPFLEEFPYMPLPHSGYDHEHHGSN